MVRTKMAAVFSLVLALGLFAMTQAIEPPAARAQASATSPMPRMPDGKPDLSGVFQDSPRRGGWDFDVPGEQVNVPVPRAPGGRGGGNQGAEPVPLTPAARARAQELLNRRSVDNPTGHCIPAPPPRINAGLFPVQFVQTPQYLVVLHEYMRVFRLIPLDGRPHPADVEPSFMGDPVGHWEGDTLVVDNIGFKNGVWLQNGILLTEAARIVERFTRSDREQIDYVATVEDPAVFTKPYTIRRTFMLREGQRIREDICPENNIDPARFQEYLTKSPDLLLRSPDKR